MKAALNFDGACHGNPGPSAGGAVLRVETSSEPHLVYGHQFVGTNNEAEYQGLIHGLRAGLERGVQHIAVRGDSKLVVEQVHGRWGCHKAHLKPLLDEARSLLSRYNSWTLEWVPREHNSAADRAANEALRRYPR